MRAHSGSSSKEGTWSFVCFKDYSGEDWKRIIMKTESHYCYPEMMVTLTVEASVKKEKEIKKIKCGEQRKP